MKNLIKIRDSHGGKEKVRTLFGPSGHIFLKGLSLPIIWDDENEVLIYKEVVGDTLVKVVTDYDGISMMSFDDDKNEQI